MKGFPSLPSFPDNGQVITVSQTINKAIQQAEAGSTIVIPSGTYRESLVVNKNLRIRGDGNVTLQSSPGKDTITLNADICIIENVTVEPGLSQSSSGINFLRGSALVKDCKISCEYLPPIMTHSDGSIYFSGCTVSSTEASILYIGGNACAEFKNSTICSSGTMGIIANGSSKLRLIDQTKIENCGDTGLLILDRASLEMDSSTIANNRGDGIEFGTTSEDNYIRNSRIVNFEEGVGITCSGSGKVEISNSEISECGLGIQTTNGFRCSLSQCQVHDVKKSALIYIAAMSEVSVTGGALYSSSIGIVADRTSQLNLYGGRIEKIEKNGVSLVTGSKASIREFTFQEINNVAIQALDGVELTMESCKFSSIQSIGVFMQGNVKGSMKSVVFDQCSVSGLLCLDNEQQYEFDSLIVERCGTEESDAGLGIRDSNAKLVNCRFAENLCGCRVKGGKNRCSFETCDFSGNGTGLMAQDRSAPSLSDCQVSGNNIGVVIEQQSRSTFNGCTFSSNQTLALFESSGAYGQCSKCDFLENVIGVQLQDMNTAVSCTECKFLRHQQFAVISNEGAKASLANCQIQDTEAIHMRAISQGQLALESCELSGSGQGIGIFVDEGGSADLSKCVMSNENQSALFLSPNSKIQCAECDISNCGVCVYIQGGEGCFKGNKVHDSPIGFQVVEGKHSIQKNEIFNTNIAVNISPDADPQVIENTFNNNEQADVYRE